MTEERAVDIFLQSVKDAPVLKATPALPPGDEITLQGAVRVRMLEASNGR